MFKYLMEQFEEHAWPEFLRLKWVARSSSPCQRARCLRTVQRPVLGHESSDAGPTLLCQAALGGHTEMVKLLLKNGAFDTFNPSEPASNSRMVKPLMIKVLRSMGHSADLCSSRSSEIVKAILASDA